MRRSRLGVVGVLLTAAAAAGVLTGTAIAVGPSATASHTLAGGSTPTACGGTRDVTVTVTGRAGGSGQATDVVLALDVSTSIATPSSKLTQLKKAALDALAALDAADGTTDGAIAGNRVGIVTYRGSAATVVRAVGSSYGSLVDAVNLLPKPSGESPHDKGISTASAALASGTAAKAIVLVTDGLATASVASKAQAAAAAAKGAGVRILAIAIGGDASKTNLGKWASSTGDVQPAPISKPELVGDLGALVVIPAGFTVVETLGTTFSAGVVSASTGTVTPGSGTLTWTGTFAAPTDKTETLVFRVTRNGSDVLGVAIETVSTLSLSVTGGTATVNAPAELKTDVLPCGGTLLARTTCSGGSCSATGSVGGVKYSLDAGTPSGATDVFLTGFDTSPPDGVCPGFVRHTGGVQYDLRPLTTDATFELVIPRSALGWTPWWLTQVCFGTNLPFTTEIQTLANLRPSAKPGGDRWWGLLPSVPRLVFVKGLGWVVGPWITHRGLDRSGNAIVRFKVPYVPGSTAFTTDGNAAYDPKLWG